MTRAAGEAANAAGVWQPGKSDWPLAQVIFAIVGGAARFAPKLPARNAADYFSETAPTSRVIATLVRVGCRQLIAYFQREESSSWKRIASK